jgi:hypothetical protein
MGRPLVMRGVTYRPDFYNLSTFDDKKEAKYILKRQWVFATQINKLFKTFETLKDVTKGL